MSRARGQRLIKQPDEAILALARALARSAARDDHERDRQARGDLRPILD